MLGPIATQFNATSGRIGFSGESLVNYLIETGEGVGNAALLGREGYVAFATLAAGNPVRGMIGMGGNLYASCGGTLYKITPGGTVSSIGSVPDAAARMAVNSTQVAIAADRKYYLATASTISQPSVGALPGGVTDVAFIDGYFMLSGSTGVRGDAITISALNDGTSFNAIDLEFSEDEPDSIVALAKQGQYVWLLNQRSYEVFYNSGAAAFPFIPTGNFSGEDGCVSRASVVRSNDVVFWVRPDGAVMAGQGYVPQEISPPHIKEVFAANAILSSLAWTDRGHEMIGWRFADRPTLAFDLTSGRWVEYSTDATDSPFAMTCQAEVGGVEYFGTDDGRIVKRSRTAYDDAGRVIAARAVSIPTDQGGRYFSVPRLYINFDGGEANLGRAAQVMMQTSKDGRTWSATKPREMGGLGDYYKRAVWNALGTFQRFQFRVTITDPVPRDIWGAQIG
jgi:hypothetical protein